MRGRMSAARAALFAGALAAFAVGATSHIVSNITSPRRTLAAAVGTRGAGFWHVQGSKFFDANGNQVLFSGVTWSGFETPDAIVHGIENRSYKAHLQQMLSLGFNMLRLSFAGDTLLPTTMPKQNIWLANPDLWGKNSLQCMDAIIAACGALGIKVILDYHRIHLTNKNELGLWYDATTPESTWINNWAMLAARYKGNPTVIGADVFNEVHHPPTIPANFPSWTMPTTGLNETYNFRSACVRLISKVHPINPDWIIFIEGMWQGYWWGGNVAMVQAAPITEPAGKIALSAHEYGPAVYPQGIFFSKQFPNNMLPMYNQRWGSIQKNGIAPVWIGEFGSIYPPATTHVDYLERYVFHLLINYIKQVNVPWTLAFWNPDSKDTGGILKKDYISVNWNKVQLLKPIMHPNFQP